MSKLFFCKQAVVKSTGSNQQPLCTKYISNAIHCVMELSCLIRFLLSEQQSTLLALLHMEFPFSSPKHTSCFIFYEHIQKITNFKDETSLSIMLLPESPQQNVLLHSIPSDLVWKNILLILLYSTGAWNPTLVPANIPLNELCILQILSESVLSMHSTIFTIFHFS